MRPLAVLTVVYLPRVSSGSAPIAAVRSLLDLPKFTAAPEREPAPMGEGVELVLGGLVLGPHPDSLRAWGCRVTVVSSRYQCGVLESSITVVTVTRWLSRKLYLWSCRRGDDWHDVTLTRGDERITFGCYGDCTGSWFDGWEFSCSCEPC